MRLSEVDYLQIDADLVVGETPAWALAERYDVSERTITRRRAFLRKSGIRMRQVSSEDATMQLGPEKRW